MQNTDSFFTNYAPSFESKDSTDYSEIIASIRAYARLNGQSAILIDFDRHEPIFVTDNLIYVDESQAGDRKRASANPYWSLVTDEVLQVLVTMRQNYFKLREVLTTEEYVSHICIIDYPITIRNREFFINSRYTPLVTGKNGETKLGLYCILPSNKKEISSVVIVPSGKRWRYDFSINDFQEFSLIKKLTIAERAVLQRAKMGMSNEEIAKALDLTLSTIKSHKMHIFKKLGVESIAEALVVVGNYNLM